MIDKELTYDTLWNLVDIEPEDSRFKTAGMLFLEAMYDWPTFNLKCVNDFVTEFKSFFGSPITTKNLNQKKIGEINSEVLDISNGESLWRYESKASIIELIGFYNSNFNLTDFDDIIKSLINYYMDLFKTVDFIADLHYLKTDKGGRHTPVYSGYRPAIQFDFEPTLLSGQQLFITVDSAYPGDNITAKIKLASPDYCINKLQDDLEFKFYEGNQLIGTGKITNIINSSLEYASS